MADMVAAVRRMPEAKRAQYCRLVGVRAMTGCTKSIVELVSADLLLQLNGMDYAGTARIVAALTTINTVSDFVFNPIMGGLLDAYGRKVSLLAAQVLDGTTALLVGVRPSVPNFVIWQLLREFSRRANKPARLAMMGDFVGRASADFVHLYNFAEVVSEATRLVAMQVVARSIGDSAHLGFLGAAGCSLGAFILALTLDESLPASKVKRIRSLGKLANPFSFFAFFCQSRGLAGMGGLLAGWQLAGRKMLPIKNFQKLQFGWGVREQANFAILYQLSELIKPVLLPTMVGTVGGGNLRTVAQTDRCIDALIWLLHALSPTGNYLAAIMQAFQHGDPCVEKVIATEAERVGAGQGEMYAAQQNVEFMARLVMPWVYGELFARAVSFKDAGGTGPLAFVGLPFVLAAILDLCTAKIAVPLAWKFLGFNPTWAQSGAPLEAGHQVKQNLNANLPRPFCADTTQQTSMEQRPMVRYYSAHDTTEPGTGGEPDMVEVYLHARMQHTRARRTYVNQGACGEKTDMETTRNMVAYYNIRGIEPVLVEIYARRTHAQ